MSDTPPRYLTTRELAGMLRIGERKVYELAATGEVPCVRVVGKLLFPRAEIEAWIATARSGPEIAPEPLPPIVAGSHDPLLDWALRESGSGLAAFFDGSHDGLARLAARKAAAAGMHVHETSPEGDGWNRETLRAALPRQPVVLVEFARRRRGLLLGPGAKAVCGITDLAGLRLARRQASAASQRLFETLAARAGLDGTSLPGPQTPARTEDEVARMIRDGAADAAFGLECVARQSGLGFVPLLEERFDLALWRRAWFEPPMQRLLRFLDGAAFRARAEEMGGYDISNLGRVHFNGP